MTGITQLLSAIDGGDEHAPEELLPLVYHELRALAVQRMGHERPGQTLQPTALVHEAYLRLIDVQRPQAWSNRGHFFAAAAEAMRRILVERARHKQSVKAGGNSRRQAMPDVPAGDGLPPADLLALNDVLERFEIQDPRRAQVVKLRFFSGLTIEETADALGISTSTADNDWAYARSWLRLALDENGP